MHRRHPRRDVRCSPAQPAAVKCGAQLIVTRNLKDFPPAELAAWNIEARSPDDFVLDQTGINDRLVATCVQQIADSRANPPEAAEDILAQLERASTSDQGAQAERVLAREHQRA